MKPKPTALPWILLAVSLAFNVFFAVGFLRARGTMHKARSFRGRAEVVAKRLRLDAQQLKVFRGLLDKVEQLRAGRAPHRDAFLAEIVKDEPDEKVLQDFVAGESVRKYRLARLGVMRKFIRLMHPRQREMFVEMVKRRTSRSK